MVRVLFILMIGSLLVGGAGCGLLAQTTNELPIETSFSFTNLSRTMYAQLELRPQGDDGDGVFFPTPLLPPGATYRRRFLEALGDACPRDIDLRILLFHRTNDDVPIGLDAGEAVDPQPVVAGEFRGVPVCAAEVAETYTIVNWDAPTGMARVKLAQGTPVEALIRSLDLFPNPDAVWEVNGVSADLGDTPPQTLATIDAIEGRVITADGTGVADVGVLMRTRFRVRLTDNDPGNDPDADFGDPIDVVTTDTDGSFRFDRPPGAYRIEVFSDTLAFRPGSADVESPVDTLWFVAEPVEP